MSLYPYPNVPNVAGVPQIPRSPLFPPAETIGLGLLQGLLWTIFQVQTQWGIFDSFGNSIGDPSLFTGIVNTALQAVGFGSTLSTGSVEYDKETSVSDFPVEQGGFASYNKVERPATPIVIMLLDGSESDRTYFLNAIDAATKSTDLYSVVTPEVTYINYTISKYNYSRRAAKGATLLMVEIHLVEIRQVSVAYAQTIINNPQDAGATPQVDGGIVQPQTPPTSALNSIGKAIPGLASDASSYIQNLVQ